MPETPDIRARRFHAAGRFSRWQYHQDQIRRQWVLHQHLTTHIKLVQQEAHAILAPAETLRNEIIGQVLGRYNWEPLSPGGSQLTKNPEAPQRLTA